jgi:hypothetical protein
MRLNEDQLMVIRKTREYMEGHGSSTYYICHAIGKVILALTDDETFSHAQASQIKNQLSTGILAGISHMVTFGGFMLLTCPVISNVYHNNEDAYDDLITMARMAWLDWIIHTGEIKADKVLGKAEKLLGEY